MGHRPFLKLIIKFLVKTQEWAKIQKKARHIRTPTLKMLEDRHNDYFRGLENKNDFSKHLHIIYLLPCGISLS